MKRLLLIDDDPRLARAVERVLKRNGYDVVVAASCSDALRQEGAFDLGVFDVELPDGNGVDLAWSLMNAMVVKRCVFFSGSGDPTVRARASELGTFASKERGVSQLLVLIDDSFRVRRRIAVGAEGQAGADSSTPPPSGIRDTAKR